jgi:hypothetical protein
VRCKHMSRAPKELSAGPSAGPSWSIIRRGLANYVFVVPCSFRRSANELNSIGFLENFRNALPYVRHKKVALDTNQPK